MIKILLKHSARVHTSSEPLSLPLIVSCNFTEKDLLIISVPSPTLENNLELIKNKISDDTQIISASKGFDKNGNTLSVLIKNKLNISENNIGVLSGPNLSSEILMGKPATSLLSFNDINKADNFRDIISNEIFRVYSGNDVIGSEIGGSLKNIIAIEYFGLILFHLYKRSVILKHFFAKH